MGMGAGLNMSPLSSLLFSVIILPPARLPPPQTLSSRSSWFTLPFIKLLLLFIDRLLVRQRQMYDEVKGREGKGRGSRV
jgi:hypothetical protein